MALADRFPIKLLDSTDPEDVKMWADKLRLLLLEIMRLLDGLTTVVDEDVPGTAVWSVGAFFAGPIEVGQAVPRFLVPEEAAGFVLTNLEVTYQAGTLTGDTEIEVWLRRGGVDLFIGTSTLTSGAVADTIYSVLLAGEATLQEGDLIKWDCVTAGGHEEVTAVVMGRQET